MASVIPAPTESVRKILTLFGLLVAFQSFGQKDCNFSVKGRILDLMTKEPVSFATVRIADTSRGEVADVNGKFEIRNLCQGEFDLEISHIGYKPVIHHHDEFHEDPTILLAPDQVILESIVVEGEHAPGDLETTTSSRITGKELSRVQGESLGNVASQIAGVNTISTGQNVVKPVIHGLHSNRILVINNGLRHEFQNWGTDHAPEIDPSLYEDLEVIKGAGTVRYGPDALGGVILINPARIELSSHLHGDVKLTGSSNGRSGEGTVKLQKGFKNFGIQGETSWLKQGDLRAPDYNLTNTGKFERSYAAGIRIHPIDAIDINAYYSHFDQELGILRGGVNGNLDDLIIALNSDVPNETGSFRYDINTPKQKIAHDLFKLEASYADEHQLLTIQYGRQFNHRREFDVRRGNNNEIANINLELITNSFDVDWSHPDIGPITGKIGAQWLKQDNDNIPGTNTIPFIPNYEGTRFGIYVIESITEGKNTYEAGLRYDTQSTDIAGRDRRNDIFRDQIEFDNLTATIGLRRRINNQSTFRTNFGTAWRPPNVAELYRFGRHLTFIEYGLWRYDFTEEDQITTRNVLTDNERPVPSEVGYKWINSYELTKSNYRFEVTGYINYIRNFIFTRPAGITRTVRGTAPFFIYEQGDALFWGIDIASNIQHSDLFNSSVKGSYLWSKQVDQNDNFVGQPPANLNYQLNYTPELKIFAQTEFSLLLDYTFEQFQAPRTIPIEDLLNAQELGINLFGQDDGDFDIIDPPSGYFLTHFSWTSSLKQFELNFQVRNLLNTSYRNYTDRIRYFADDLGRNFILSITYRL